MAPIAKGFALHSGQMPPKSNICILLEAAGGEEPVFLVKDLEDGDAELARRRERYASLGPKFQNLGVPVVGRAGSLMWNWLMKPLGLIRADVAVFNCLSCFPGKGPDGNFFYPTGNVRKRAEATCSDLWMRPLLEWQPTVSIVCFHPSALSRDITPLPVALRAIEKAKMFASKGERVLLLMGGKAAHHWMSYGSNVTRWTGHWQADTDWIRARRQERWNTNRRLTVTKVAKVRKLTLKQEVIALLNQNEPQLFDEGRKLWTIYVDDVTRDRILALTVTKKKGKEVATA